MIGELQGNIQILATRGPRRENPVLINLRNYKDQVSIYPERLCAQTMY